MARALSLRVGYPGVVGITHGRQISAANTGLNFHGISAGSLTTTGTTTYDTSFNGATISGKAFTGPVTVTAVGLLLKDCTWLLSGSGTNAIYLNGSSNTVEGCKISAPSGQSMYNCISIGGDSNTIRYCDLSGAENLIQPNGTNMTVQYSYGHDCSVRSNLTGHADGVEMFTGSILFQYNRWEMGGLKYDGAFNISPYDTPTHAVTRAQIWDNFIDGGGSHLLIDNQTTNPNALQNLSVLRNDFGGHTNPDTSSAFGIYHPLYNADGRAIVETAAALAASPNSIYWPTSGADANYWAECSRVIGGINPDGTTVSSDTGVLSPDKSGLICTATG